MLREIPLHEILIEGRIREDLGDIKDLAENFKQKGIIQPIAVMELATEETNGHRYRLLAGGRRCAAALEAQIKSIPANIYPSTLTELDKKEIELWENLYRKDMTWQEECKIKKEIHELKVSQYGQAVKSSEGWSMTDTSDLLRESKSLLIEDVNLAGAMEIIPQLTECKNKNEAKKLLKKLQTNMLNAAAAKEIQQDRSNTPENIQKRRLIDSYIVDDFLVRSKEIESNSMDIIEIDPPYAIDLDKLRDSKTGMINYHEVEQKEFLEFMIRVVNEAHRILRPEGWLILWFGLDPWYNSILQILSQTEFKFSHLPAMWVKTRGQTLQPKYNLANVYEPFFYARKSEATITLQGRSNVFSFPGVGQSRIHPTERPIELIEEVLRTFGHTGASVLSPFLGSGNTILAASNIGMSCFGYDLSKEYKDAYTVRVNLFPVGQHKSYTRSVVPN